MKRTLSIVGAAVLACASLLNAQAVVPAGTFIDKPGNVNFVCNDDPGCVTNKNPTKVMQSFVTNVQGAQIGPRLLLGAANFHDNTTVSDNGAGTYFAGAGVDVGPTPTPYAFWNVAVYIGSFNQQNYDFRLFLDFNPAEGNTLAQHGHISLSCTSNCTTNAGLLNPGELGFGDGTNYVPPPTLFNPNAYGQYSFALVAYERAQGAAQYTNELTRVAIQVNVVPEPATGALMLVALGLTGLAVRRRSRAA